MDTGVGSEFHTVSVQSQESDIVVVGSRTVTLVFDHSQHFVIHVFRFIVVAAVVFQKTNADIFSFESILNLFQIYLQVGAAKKISAVLLSSWFFKKRETFCIRRF